MSEPKLSDLLIAKFHVKPSDIWVERDGKTVRGTRPKWLDYPMYTADQIGPKWEVPRKRK
jgi:hypothetical protein